MRSPDHACEPVKEQVVMSNTDIAWVAEHVMGFARGHCQGTYGGGNIGEAGCETWQWCDWCHREIRNFNSGPCPEYPFPGFTLTELMHRLGEIGYSTMVRYDTLRTSDNFTVTFDGLRVGDTDRPLEALCKYIVRILTQRSE